MTRVRNSDPSTTKHDALSKALEETSAELPKVGKKSPPWSCKAKEELEPLLKKRNECVEEYMTVSRHPSKKKMRGRMKECVKAARKAWDKAVVDAKSAWVESHCLAISNVCVGAFDCGKKVWEAISQLKAGISKTKPSTDVPLKTKDGVTCKDAAENAARFKEHFSELYGKEEWYDETGLGSIPQHDPKVWEDQGRTPDADEIKVAVRRLNVSGPGITGISAAVLKALLLHDEAFNCLVEVVLHFWESEEVPAQWEECLLKILPKSGDLSQPGNYRGIMLLEVLLKVVKQLLKARLSPIQESLDHESQCGFRPNKGCTDANFVLRLVTKRRKEHGLETWVLLLDLVKAFDRVPRSLLWKVMLKFGVPAKLVSLLKALHRTVKVNFTVDEVREVMLSIIGVKQGDLLGPQLFIFHICAIMMSWRAEHNDDYEMCTFRTKMDAVVRSRSPVTGGKSGRNCTEFKVSDSEYADDTGLVFCDRESVARMAPVINDHFRRWGMEVHEKKPGDTKVKTLVLFCAAPSSTYTDPDTYDNTDLSDIVLPSGNVIPIVSKAKYLGSMMSRDSTDDTDVDARITAASRAFGALSKCVFKSRSISLSAKRAAYVALVLSILLYGSECWCLTATLWRKLRTFHRSCTRAMCRINRWHTWKCRISAASVSQRLGLESLETYVVKRQLQWAGHVARMGEHRLPRKLLTAWCYNKRPKGRPEFTYGEGLEFALSYAKVDRGSWMEQAQEKGNWQAMLKAIGTGAPELDLHPLLVARSEYISPPPPSPAPTATASSALTPIPILLPSPPPPSPRPPLPQHHPHRTRAATAAAAAAAAITPASSSSSLPSSTTTPAAGRFLPGFSVTGPAGFSTLPPNPNHSLRNS